MTNDQAIKMINEQIVTIQYINENTQKAWLVQTTSLIRDIFGTLSDECRFITSFSFTSFYSDESFRSQFNNTSRGMIEFLNNCIVTITRKDLFKPQPPVIKYVEKIVPKVIEKEVIKEVYLVPPKRNLFTSAWKWISRKDVLALISTVIAILGLPFGIGWFLGEQKADLKNIDLRQENKQLISDTAQLGQSNRSLIFKLRDTLEISSKKPDTNTKSD